MRGRRLTWMLALSLSAAILVLPHWSAHQAEWPRISDAAALGREAAALCREEGGGWHELPPSRYPAAMTALRPASISVSSERVYVALVPVPGGRRFHGYYIRPDGNIIREESDAEPSGL